MPYTGSPPTFTSGQKTGVASGLNNLRDFARAFTDAWTSYDPVLTASTTNPTGWTREGYYAQAGKLVIAKWALTAGVSVSAGSGTYRVALPVAAKTAVPYGPRECWLFDSSATATLLPRLELGAGTYATMWYPASWPSGTNTAVGSGTYTWAVGDLIVGAVIYEAA